MVSFRPLKWVLSIMTTISLRTCILFSIILINCIAGTALAAENSGRIKLAVITENDAHPEDVIRYRQALMMSMQGLVNAAFLIGENKIADDGRLIKHLNALDSVSHELENAFPAGTGRGSDALPNIWDEPSRFNRANLDIQEAVDMWLEAAKGGDLKVARKASRKVAKACRGCHERYRTPTDD